MGDAVPRGAEVGDEAADAFERGLERREAGQLAADMERDSAHLETRQRGEPAEDFGRAVDADAELVLGLAGRNLGMRSRVDVGIDAQHRARGRFAGQRDFGERDAFGFVLDVELADAAVEALRQFGARLADARKDDVLGRHARRERAFELAARHDVGAITLPREDAQHAEVGIALDREGDVLARNILQRVAEHLCVALERRARIDIDGSADFFGDARQGRCLRRGGRRHDIRNNPLESPKLSPEAASQNRRLRGVRTV